MKLKKIIFLTLISLLGGLLGFFFSQRLFSNKLINPFVKETEFNQQLPLQAYTIENLQKQNFPTRQPITINGVLVSENQTEKFIFNYHSQGKNISGALNIAYPQEQLEQGSTIELSTIILLRGWAPIENYYIGLGTKNAAQAFAQAGYLTLAPDFLGYGQSDEDLSDTWEARFIKPINVIDLLNTLKAYPEIIVPEELGSNIQKIKIQSQEIGIWAHSNGGQIALTALEILQESIPSTLWAPVTAPFPYSILFYSDEHLDEGKEMRKYLSIFEKDYDVFDFSLTHHLDALQGPLQIHHGAKDLEAPIDWSEDFIKKLEAENQRRLKLDETPITYNYYRYEDADHNLRPDWQTVINRDIDFFNRELKNN